MDAYAAHLLVVAEAEVHRCPEGVEVGGLHQDEGGGQEALHVGRAPGAQLAVDLRQFVRVGGPARSGGHHVGVAGQQHASRGIGSEPEVQVGPPGLAVHHSDHRAGGGGPIGVKVDQFQVRRPTLGREGHQVGEQVDEAVGGRISGGNHPVDSPSG